MKPIAAALLLLATLTTLAHAQIPMMSCSSSTSIWSGNTDTTNTIRVWELDFTQCNPTCVSTRLVKPDATYLTPNNAYMHVFEDIHIDRYIDTFDANPDTRSRRRSFTIVESSMGREDETDTRIGGDSWPEYFDEGMGDFVVALHLQTDNYEETDAHPLINGLEVSLLRSGACPSSAIKRTATCPDSDPAACFDTGSGAFPITTVIAGVLGFTTLALAVVLVFILVTRRPGPAAASTTAEDK